MLLYICTSRVARAHTSLLDLYRQEAFAVHGADNGVPDAAYVRSMQHTLDRNFPPRDLTIERLRGCGTRSFSLNSSPVDY